MTTDPMPPPEVLSLPVVRCPACDHGIDPHGLDPGGYCGVGDENGVLCECLWSPNDIAAWRAVDMRDRLIEAWDRDNHAVRFNHGHDDLTPAGRVRKWLRTVAL
jgi:hypothetical protein